MYSLGSQTNFTNGLWLHNPNVVKKNDSAFKRQKLSDHVIILRGSAAVICVNVSLDWIVKPELTPKWFSWHSKY